MKNKEIVYFQPEGIKPKYCEAGVIMENDPDHIWFLDEPCKILKSEVKIIPKEFVHFDKKTKCYLVIKDPAKESVVYKMTPVDWLIEKINNYDFSQGNAQLRKYLLHAKKMERQHSIGFASEILNNAECSWTGVVQINESLEDIYDGIYGKF